MPLDMRQQNLPMGLSPQAGFKDIAARSVHPGIPLPDLGKVYAAELQARCLHPPPLQSLLRSHDKEFCGKQFSQPYMRSWCAATATTTPHGALESSQRRLLIFDQSGNQTRLLQCPFPLRYPSYAAAEPVKLSELHSEDGVEFDEEHVSGKEFEMHEDTEEINALLYSDDDDDDDDDDCESDDEVMSTGHSPYPIELVCNKRELEEINGPCKRQKLLDKVSSLVGTKGSTQLNGSSILQDKKVLESNTSTKEDTGSGLSNEQSKKDKIRTALKILESIVPSAKGNEALLLLDEAIDYLKLLKRDLIST